jgi:hypothetical protein
MKYRYLAIGENYRLIGTNDENEAFTLCEELIVYDLESGFRIDVPLAEQEKKIVDAKESGYLE